MKYVELTADVAEGGRDLDKAQAAAAELGITPRDPRYPQLKVTVGKRGRTEFRKGLVVLMTDDGAAKWVDRGIAKVVDKPAE